MTRFQFYCISLWLVLGTGVLTLPYAIAQYTIRDGWLAILLCLVPSAVTAVIAHWFVRTFPGQSFSAICVSRVGPVIGRVLLGWGMIVIFINTSTVFRELLIFLEVNTLPHTPLAVIAGIMVIPVAYVFWYGVRSLARIAGLLTPLAIVVSAFLVLLSLQDMHITELRPILADGFTPVLRGSVTPGLVYTTELMMVLEFADLHPSPKKIGKDIFVVSAIIIGILCVAMVLIEGSLGGAVTYLTYPILEVVRGIAFGEFLQRMDTFYVIGIVCAMFIKISVFCYCFIHQLANMFSLENIRGISLSGTVLQWAGSLTLFRNSTEMFGYIMFIAPTYVGLTFLCSPILCILLVKLKESIGGIQRA